MTRPFRVEAAYALTGADGQPEFMACVYDVALKNLPAGHPIPDVGDDYFCTYGPTALDAVLKGVRLAQDGSAARYFQGVRREYGLPSGDALTGCPVPHREPSPAGARE